MLNHQYYVLPACIYTNQKKWKQVKQNTDVNIGTIRGEIDIYFRDAGKWIHRPGALTAVPDERICLGQISYLVGKNCSTAKEVGRSRSSE